MSGRIEIVVGGQFGSEAKGHLTAQLAARSSEPVLAIRVGGPNAGHIVVDGSGREWKLRQIPTPAVSDPGCLLAIAAGSEIDLEVLLAEVNELDAAGFNVSGRLVTDPTATVIEPGHKDTESDALVGRIGSTGKGVGAARADRIMREASLAYDLRDDLVLDDVAGLAAAHLAEDGRVILEGAQGYGLGLHAEYYPFCTSTDCTAIDVLAAARISPWQSGAPVAVWIAMRPRPIRVAGNSGPLQGETSWGALGLPDEHTTVTGKVRRVGEWDPELAQAAVLANGGPARNVGVALMQFDKEFPSFAGQTDINALAPADRESLDNWRQKVHLATGAWIRIIGTSPNTVMWIPRAATIHEHAPSLRYGSGLIQRDSVM